MQAYRLEPNASGGEEACSKLGAVELLPSDLCFQIQLQPGRACGMALSQCPSWPFVAQNSSVLLKCWLQCHLGVQVLRALYLGPGKPRAVELLPSDVVTTCCMRYLRPDTGL